MLSVQCNEFLHMYTYVITTQLKTYISSTIRSFFCPTLVRKLSLQGGLYSDLHHQVLVLSDSELHRHESCSIYHILCFWFLSCNILSVKFIHVFTFFFIATYIIFIYKEKYFCNVLWSYTPQ